LDFGPNFALTDAVVSVIKAFETVIASAAKQSSLPRKERSWIVSSLRSSQ
jgi:hypothetical protein